jgi:hypothetical protein
MKNLNKTFYYLEKNNVNIFLIYFSNNDKKKKEVFTQLFYLKTIYKDTIKIKPQS